ncbi:MAG TPA: type II secretion system F family protein [Anaerolineales bacterium]|jgi:tight adherence protein B|nr:type II secretion system F family protein [Anaerolineales bacterium]
MPLILWIGIISAVVLLVVGLFVTLTGQRSLVDQRLEAYLQQEKAGEAVTEGEVKQAREALLTSWITRQVERTDYGDKIARELARADLKLKTGEYVALIIISSGLTAFFGYFFGGQSLLFAFIGLVLGPFIPRFFVKRQQAVRLRKFNDQLPDMLNLMVNGLRTGFSALQAMEAVSRELPAPISDEFRRVVQEMQLGVPMEGALDNLQRRIASDDLDLAVTAINIQREVGGNLAEILETISYTIRERVRIKGEVSAITAQVALSGRFLSLMPIFLALILWGLNRDYMMQFFEPPLTCGLSILGLAGVMLVFGYFTLNRLGKIEI